MTRPDEVTTLRAALMRERAAHAQTREALREAQSRWEAVETARRELTKAHLPPGSITEADFYWPTEGEGE